ncbi:MAG: tetratricopeptide repeat protein [Bacteroidota bacterium]
MATDINTFIEGGIRAAEHKEWETAYQQLSRAVHLIETENGAGLIEEAQAEIYFQRAISLLSQNEARTLNDKDSFHQVLTDLEQAVDLNPVNSSYRIHKGRLYMQASFIDYSEKAQEDFQFILEKDSKHVEALRSMGELFSRTGKFTDAIDYLTQALEHNEDAEIYLLRAVCQFKKSPPNFTGSLVDLRKAQDLGIHTAELFLWRAQGLQELGRKGEAIATYNELIEMDPDNPDYYVDRGFLYDADNPDLAMEDYSKALELEPHALAYNNRANYYRRIGQFEAAIADAKDALKLEQNMGIAYATLAEIYAEIGDAENLAKYMRLAMKYFYEDSVEVMMEPVFGPYLDESWFQEILQ